MPGTFNCPTCGAPLDYPGNVNTVRCPYCGNSVIVPEELRKRTSDQLVLPAIPGGQILSADQLAEIKRHIQLGQKIEAIKVYRQATLVGLKEAKDAVEAIEAANPDLKAYSPAAGAGIKLAAPQKRPFLPVLLVGLFFFAIAAIFPVVFFPMGVEAWQMGEYVGSIAAFVGAGIWALVWGGIGGLIVFSKG